MNILKMIKTIFLGENTTNKKNLIPAIKNQWKNFLAVKNNTKDESFGIDRIFRFILVLSSFVFPTLYIRHYFGKKGLVARKLAIEAVVVIKLFLPLLYLWLNIESFGIVLCLNIYLMTETLFYLLGLVFLSDIYIAPLSFRRSFILLALNYIELNFCFAVIYKGLELIPKIKTNINAIYFSFVTSATIGYGDISPICELGQLLVVVQILVMILFIVLFFNKFIPSIGQNNHNSSHNNQK